MKHLALVGLVCGFLSATAAAAAQEAAAFSGPQAGEKLTPFVVKGVFDEQAGREIDFVKQADGKPILLVFVHEFNRPSVAVTRILMDYAATRQKDGLAGGIVMLNDDYTAEVQRLKRARHALPKSTPIGVSVDGREGPGAYGLNRNVTLTVLVAKNNRVTANFALVQPSVQADVPRVLEAVVKQVGGQVPQLSDLVPADRMKQYAGNQDQPLTNLLRQLIRKDAQDADVDRVAAAIEKLAAEDRDAKRDVGTRAQRIVQAGKLENYGTEKAQAYLQKWAKEFGGAEKSP